MSLLHFDRTWKFQITPIEFWDTVSQTEQFTNWWPWLRQLDVEGLGDQGPQPGTVAHCAIGWLLPYNLHMRLEVTEAIPFEYAHIKISGDTTGLSSLILGENPADKSRNTCLVRMKWDVALHKTSLRLMYRINRPFMERRHTEWIDNGAQTFAERAFHHP